MQIEIKKMDHNGNGIGYDNNKVIFVPKSIVGDVCEVEIIASKRKYDLAIINKKIKNSKDYVPAICPYYNICGGCNISNLSYENQLLFKKNKVKNIFKKYLNIDIDLEIIPSEFEYKYRNKITYKVENGTIGLIDINNNLIEIEKCYLVSDRVNNLYNKIKKEDLTLVKKIIIRECDNGLVLSIFGKMNIEKLLDKCIEIYIDNVCVYRNSQALISIDDIKYEISANSFFQINSSTIKKLYDLIIKNANFNKTDKVIDLYCGVGSISLYISKYVKKVLGIEIIKEAIIDAKKNALLNNINNVAFICGDVAKVVDENVNSDVFILDPPRSGVDKKIINIINERKIKKIVYISCNPITLVRDIKLLNDYEIKTIVALDMFPQTAHIECVCVLKLK